MCLRRAGHPGSGDPLLSWLLRCVFLSCQPAPVSGALRPRHPLPLVWDPEGPAGARDPGRTCTGPVSVEWDPGAPWGQPRGGGSPGRRRWAVPQCTPVQGESPAVRPGSPAPVLCPTAQELRHLRHAGPAPGERPQGLGGDLAGPETLGRTQSPRGWMLSLTRAGPGPWVGVHPPQLPGWLPAAPWHPQVALSQGLGCCVHSLGTTTSWIVWGSG